MSHLYRLFLAAVVCLFLAACTTDASTLLPTTLPGSSPTPTITSARATATLTTPTSVPVTASPAPTPKPAVLRVAYSGGGHIMLWTEGKGSHPLGDVGNAEDVRISDDGQVIAYIGQNSSGIYGIWAINADGTHQRLLAGQDYVQNIQPINRPESFDFAPASHTVYFTTYEYDLHRVNADSGAPTPLFGPGQGGFFSFSPNGQWMTLYNPRELVLARSDGSAAPRVVYDWSPDFGVGTTGPEIIWAPDSAGFRMVTPTDPQGDPDSMTVWYIPVNGNPVKQMSYAGPYGNLSPDGRTVVYLDGRREPVEVHVIGADGKDTTYNSYSAKSYFNVIFLGWAPDSKHFLLNLSKDGRLIVPYLCAVGKQPVKLTDTDDAHAVVWIDAQRALFVSHGKTLHLQRVGAPSVLLDATASSWFDYTYVNPS